MVHFASFVVPALLAGSTVFAAPHPAPGQQWHDGEKNIRIARYNTGPPDNTTDPTNPGNTTSVDPTDPGNTTSVDPTNPDNTTNIDPTNPDNTTSIDPTNPGNTTTTGDPSNPGNTTTAGDPTNPGNTTTVGDPTNPGNTTTVGNSTNPGNATTVGDPTDPGNTTSVLELFRRESTPPNGGGTNTTGNNAPPCNSGSPNDTTSGLPPCNVTAPNNSTNPGGDNTTSTISSHLEDGAISTLEVKGGTFVNRVSVRVVKIANIPRSLFGIPRLSHSPKRRLTPIALWENEN